MTTPGPTVHPSNTTIKFSDVNAVFGLVQPSPMDLNYRFPTSLYTPTTPMIPTTPKATFPMESLHGRTKGVPAPTPFVTTFTTPGSWTSTVTGNIKVLVVAGGGGGGAPGRPAAPSPGTFVGGGGGAGGVVYCTSFPVVLGTVYPYTVGGAGQNSNFKAVIIANAGGGGGLGGGLGVPGGAGGTGGSGGGGGQGPAASAGGTATQPGVSQPANCTNYGNPGGAGTVPGPKGAAGRGGGAGGPGTSISITGAPVIYGVGGIGGASIPTTGYGYGGRGALDQPAGLTPATPGTAGCVIIAYP